jgi:hypothetical protein
LASESEADFGFTFLSYLRELSRKETEQAKFVVGLINVFFPQELAQISSCAMHLSLPCAAGNSLCKTSQCDFNVQVRTHMINLVFQAENERERTHPLAPLSGEKV